MILILRTFFIFITIVFALAGTLLPASGAGQDESSLARTVKDIVQAYNEQKAESYMKHFSEALKQKFSLEVLSGILSSNMEKYGPIENYELNISPDGRRGLIFLQMENGKFDLHLRVNDSSNLERLTWLPHKADQSEAALSVEEADRIKSEFQSIADSFVVAIADTNAELLMSLMADKENNDMKMEDFKALLNQLHERGQFSKAGELEVTGPNEVLLPIYFDSMAMAFYLEFGTNKKIAQLRISNYAAPESIGKTLAELGDDTLRTTDLLHFSRLEETFKRDSGKVRLIALLSPT